MIAKNGQHDDEAPEPKGEGVGEESGLVERRDAKLEQMAVRHRWGMTDESRTAVMNRQIRTAIDPETDERRATAAASCLVKMEAQNQADELKKIPDKHEHTVVGVLLDDDWYGTANRIVAESDAASSGDSADGREVQAGGSRSSNGKDGNGFGGGSTGPRPEEGDV